MSKVSIAKAAKLFDVSRPTLLNHLKNGKITGHRAGEAWEIDMAELKRVYQRRDTKPDTPGHADLSPTDTPPAPDLQAEIRVLQAKLEAAEALAAERLRHLDDLRKLLPGPQDQGPRRRWWPF